MDEERTDTVECRPDSERRGWIVDIDLRAADRNLGIVRVTAVLLDRAAVVMVEGSDGARAVRTTMAWPGQEFDSESAIMSARAKARSALTAARLWRDQREEGYRQRQQKRAAAAAAEAAE
ncbi:MAG: hypothetical protein AB7J30_12800 [Hyphomicrobium sp.]|uniref:hypothetical protein n=1 Tax=Hyphomicrobium sp. TaxID=82 RepID=UPI003D09B7C1